MWREKMVLTACDHTSVSFVILAFPIFVNSIHELYVNPNGSVPSKVTKLTHWMAQPQRLNSIAVQNSAAWTIQVPSSVE